ncbi:MAG: CheR family methyltransferase [Myxococcaceae bacterium]
MLTIERGALDDLAALLNERAGLKILPEGYHGLRLALTARMPALGISDAEEYVRRLKQLAGEHELRSLLPLVTVGKTDFFRDSRQFNALELRILPDMLKRARRENRKLRIWSAGCATGEEPYSLGMVLAELGADADEVDLWATDLNPAAIEHAQRGRFPLRRLTGVSDERRARFFLPVDGDWQVTGPLRRYVRFEGQNLAAPVFTKVPAGSLDLILCRNVIIYFDLPTIRGLMDRFLSSLRPEGLLLLGYSESLFKVYDKFEMIEVEGSFIYRRPPEGKVLTKPVLPAVSSPPAIASKPASRPPARPRFSTGEYAIVLPTDKAKPAPAQPSPSPVSEKKSPGERLAAAVAAMHKGDFERSLSLLQSLAGDEKDDLPSLLTLANLYSLLGRDGQAREVFAQVLSREPLCVEAHVYGAAAAMQSGRVEDAKAELQKAMFLEPTLALGHYMLAQVLEKLGDRDGARRAYRNVVAQLRFNQRPLAGYYPDLPESGETVARAARYALAALEEA